MIQQQLDKEAASKITEGQRESFLSSLSYPTIESRREAIHDAHEGTFMWIFNTVVDDGSETTSISDDETAYSESLNEERASMTAIPLLEREVMCSLKDWLQTSSKMANHTPDIYWVSGKPGSGKSTLMKFLAHEDMNNGEVMELLEQWAQGLEVLTPSFYFWKPGTPEQKSLAGMLRSLIFQLLRANDNLSKGLIDHLHSRKKLKRTPSKFECHWTVPTLDLALDYLLKATEGQFMICFFIDGLDEFEDSQYSKNKLLRRLQKLASRNHVKLCVASRPEQAFEDEYAANMHLRLEDLTYTSIVRFVEDKLKEHTQWHKLVPDRLRTREHLLRAVVQKAEGVFLWVVLAVQDVERGLDDQNDIETLFQRVSRLPSELADLYTRMLSVMSQEYQDDARKIFQWMLDRPKEYMQVIDLMFLFWPEDMQSALLSQDNSVDASSRLSGPTENLKVILRTRCVGMLEVKRSVGQGFQNLEAFDSEIRFVHRSAYDFLLASETGKAFMITRPLQIQDRYISYVNMILDNCFRELEDQGYALKHLFARFILIASTDAQTNVMTFLHEKLVELKLIDQSHKLAQLLNDTPKSWHNGFVGLTTSLGFAASFGLGDYVKAILTKDSKVGLDAEQSTDLLFCVIRGMQREQPDSTHFGSCIVSGHFDLIHLFLRRDARINDALDWGDNILSIWQMSLSIIRFLLTLASYGVTFSPPQKYYQCLIDPNFPSVLTATIRAFIDAGADLHGLARYITGEESTWNIDDQILRLKWEYKFSPLFWLEFETPDNTSLKEVISMLRVSRATKVKRLSSLVFMSVLRLTFDSATDDDDSQRNLLSELAEVLPDDNLAECTLLTRTLFERAWTAARTRTIDENQDLLFDDSDHALWEERVFENCEDPASITPEVKNDLSNYWTAYRDWSEDEAWKLATRYEKAKELDRFDERIKSLAWRLRTRQVMLAMRRFLDENIDKTASNIGETLVDRRGFLVRPWEGWPNDYPWER